VEVADAVKDAIAEVLKHPAEPLHDDTKLADLGVESIDVIEIVYMLEEKYDIDISLAFDKAEATGALAANRSSLNAFATVGDICRAVQALVDARAPQ
jgi:acyl carrier protein